MKRRTHCFFVVVLVILSVSAAVYAGTVGDINADGDVGLEEVIHALQVMAGLKPETTVEECITCSGTPNGTRWCDNGDGTVKDMTTGLIWLKKADWGGQRDWRDTASFDDAHTRAGILEPGAANADLSDGSEYGEWRLPTFDELLHLATGTEAVRSNNQRAFTGASDGYYWTSTTSENDPFCGDPLGCAMTIRIYTSYTTYSAAKSYSYGRVWPVRSGN